jgi:hypothetical protein
MTGRAKSPRQLIEAVADERQQVAGVAVVASFQMTPETDRPRKVRGIDHSTKYPRLVSIALTSAEARKLVADWQSTGLGA